jgi:hypothetical protein
VLPAIENRLATLPRELKPLADVVRRHYARERACGSDGTVQIARAPWMGPEAFRPGSLPPCRRRLGERVWATPRSAGARGICEGANVR